MPIVIEKDPVRPPSHARGLSPEPWVTRSSVAPGRIAEKSAFIGLSVLILYATVRNICNTVVKPMWFDEICTVLLSRQEHLSRLWQALARGADSAPITFYLLERIPAAFIRNENLAYRGISILGFAITLLCLFVAIRMRKGSAIALVCAAVPLSTVLFDRFSVEARGYSMLVACIAFAIVCYQRVPARRWVILLGLSLILAESFHYFAVFAFLPFLLAEAVHFGMTRDFRRSVWIALLVGFVPMACSWHTIYGMQKTFGQHYFTQPTWEMTLSSYSEYFPWTNMWGGLCLVAAASVAVIFTLLATFRETSQGERPVGASVRELTLTLGLLSLPLVGFAAAAVAHSGMNSKYLLSSVLGFSLALGFSLPRFPRRGLLLSAVSTAVLLCVIVPQEFLFWRGYDGRFLSPTRFEEELVSAAGHPGLPVVISDTHDFMRLQHYANKSWQQRFVLLVDPEQAVVYTGSDTGDKGLAILRQYTNLPIYDFQPFLAEHPTFLLYSSNGGIGSDWWPRRLKQDGFKLRIVSVVPKDQYDFYHRVILVTR
jgi:4-amino-4-deoxy-L-arabinose transferase-like glycosyltransferase